MSARLPAGARIATFPDGANPDGVMIGRCNKGVLPFPTRWQHVRATFSGPRVDNSRWRHLRRFVLPLPWIEASWRD